MSDDILLDTEALEDAERQINESIPHLHAICNDPSDIESIIFLGDLFNGLIGTFSFGAGIDINDELVDISRMIDNTTKLYKGDDLPSINEQHVAFMCHAVQFSLDLMETYKEKKSISSLQERKLHLIDEYNDMHDIEEKEVMDQDSIDSLLDEIG